MFKKCIADLQYEFEVDNPEDFSPHSKFRPARSVLLCNLFRAAVKKRIVQLSWLEDTSFILPNALINVADF